MDLRATQPDSPAPNEGVTILQTVRAFEWWEFKISPILATAYATASILGSPLLALWPLLLLALAALVPGAAFVSVINDLTDRDEDRVSGKQNRLSDKSATFIAVLLACCILPGLAVSFHWRSDPLLLPLYWAAWAAFALYSIPPVRLKSRGVLGLVADAAGAHFFPTLLVVSLVFRWHGAPIDPVWFSAIAVWSLACGLRGNLWHQLGDRQNDARADVRTFARRHSMILLVRLGNGVVFPLELTGLAVMLWQIGNPAALVALGAYGLLMAARRSLWQTRLVVVAPRERASIVMLEYYEVFLPLALLASSTTNYPQDAILLVAHLLLFPRRAMQVATDSVKLSIRAVRRLL